MAILDVDLLLFQIIEQFFLEVQRDRRLIEEIFEYRTETERDMIADYLAQHSMTQDIRNADEDNPFIYLIPSFPMMDIPLRQICIYVASEGQTDHMLGSDTGQSTVRTDVNGNRIGVDAVMGAYVHGSYIIDVVSQSKEETVILNRLCYVAILKGLEALESYGVMDTSLTIADAMLDPQYTPIMALSRRMTFAATVLHTWNKFHPDQNYMSGNNLAISDEETV
jgi:hypothetical protein